jgi:hypothetical protein
VVTSGPLMWLSLLLVVSGVLLQVCTDYIFIIFGAELVLKPVLC